MTAGFYHGSSCYHVMDAALVNACRNMRLCAGTMLITDPNTRDLVSIEAQ
jgi:hypothetical protein